MSKITFDRKQTPMTIFYDGRKVGMISKSFHGKFLLSLADVKIYWSVFGGQAKPPGTGGVSAISCDKLYEAKALALRTLEKYEDLL